jgi:hypothetical protein
MIGEARCIVDEEDPAMREIAIAFPDAWRGNGIDAWRAALDRPEQTAYTWTANPGLSQN